MPDTPQTSRWPRDFLEDVVADHDEHGWSIGRQRAAAILAEYDRVSLALAGARMLLRRWLVTDLANEVKHLMDETRRLLDE